MIRLLAHPPPPLPSVSSTSEATHRKTEKESQLANGRGGGEGVGEDLNYTTARRLVLYKSLSTLWWQAYFLGRAGRGDILSSGGHFLNFFIQREAVGLLKLRKKQTNNWSWHLLPVLLINIRLGLSSRRLYLYVCLSVSPWGTMLYALLVP
jgi:hypothetical protein